MAMRCKSVLFYLIIVIAVNVCHAGNSCAPFSMPMDFNAEVTAKELHAAISRSNSLADEKAIIDLVLAIHLLPIEERWELIKTYSDFYDEHLVNAVKNRVSKKVGEFLAAGLTLTSEYLAEQLHDGFTKNGTNDEIIIDVVNIMRGLRPYYYEVAESYEDLYDKSLLSDLESYTSGDFKTVLFLLFEYDGEQLDVDEEWAIEFAANLTNTRREKFVSKLVTIFLNLYDTDLRTVFHEYERISQRGIEDAIRINTASGSTKNLLLAMVQHAMHDEEYFARRLHESIDKVEVDYRAINRILLSRFFMIDCTLTVFEARYGKSFESCIPEDSDNYAYALKSFIRMWNQ